MKIVNQVCTLEQAKRLKKLGVDQDKSYFAYQGNLDYMPDLESDDHNDYAAFTTAELGAMLGHGSAIKWDLYNLGGIWMIRTGFINDRIPNCETEAQARAFTLLHLIENGLISIEVVNQRLSDS